MPSSQEIPDRYNDLKPQILNAIKECDQMADTIIYKLVDQINHIKTQGVEPGVEIVKGLSGTIDAVIKESIRLECDLSIITKGILIGSFRSSRSLVLEAHKTIHLILQEILQSVFNNKGKIQPAIHGLLAGIETIAQEHQLNGEAALIEAKEDILLSAEKLDPLFAENIKIILEESHPR